MSPETQDGDAAVDERRSAKSSRPAAKVRLDRLLVTRGLAGSREKARALILAGHVLVDDRPATKPGHLVPGRAELRVRQPPPYVSRGGIKLQAALQAFAIDPAGAVAVDIGASTGGFTDCLLQHGAARVYAIDVGYGQLAWSLRQDPRVIPLERTNIRYLEALPEGTEADLAVVDVAFIGLDLVLPAAARLLRPSGQAVVLIKPQFEAGRSQVGKGGVVRDPAIHRQVLERVLGRAIERGWTVRGLIRSPITGPKGNAEFLCHLQLGGTARNIEVPMAIALVLPDGSGEPTEP